MDRLISSDKNSLRGIDTFPRLGKGGEKNLINFELLTHARAHINNKSKKILNPEIWKEKVIVDSMRILPANIYRWNNNTLTHLAHR